MTIKVDDLTPNRMTLVMTKTHDVFGTVLVTRGWA